MNDGVKEMNEHPRACAGCGARLRPGAAACDLCGLAPDQDEPLRGTPVEEPLAQPVPEPETSAEEQVSPGPASDREPTPPLGEGVFCHRCGWKSPPDARFCSRCGTKLQEVAAVAPEPPAPAPTARPPAPPPPAARAEGPGQRQVLLIIGGGLLLVIGLYFITALSKGLDVNPVAVPPAAEQPATAVPPASDVELPAQLAERAAELRAEADALGGEERLARLRDLVSLYAGAGRLDRAAAVQQEVAAEDGSPTAWRLAGDLYLDWIGGNEGPADPAIAQQAVGAYEQALEGAPGDLDLRTNLGLAYVYTNDPMRGVEQLRDVLEVDSTHLPANFYYGTLLMQISRFDRARAQFEKVKTLANPASPFYQEAEARLQAMPPPSATPPGSVALPQPGATAP